MSKHTGWICPRCKASNAPKVKQCACSVVHRVEFVEPWRYIWTWQPPYFYPPYIVTISSGSTDSLEPSVSSVFGPTISMADEPTWTTSSTFGWTGGSLVQE